MDERIRSAQLREGDEEAWGCVYSRAHRTLLGIAIEKVGGTVGEDLVHDTFVVALETFHNFRGDCSIDAWLRKILRNLCCRQIAKSSKQRFLPERQNLRDNDAADTTVRDMLRAIVRETLTDLIAEEKPHSVRCKTFKCIMDILDRELPIPSARQRAEEWACSLGASKTRWSDAMARLSEKCIRRLNEYDL